MGRGPPLRRLSRLWGKKNRKKQENAKGGGAKEGGAKEGGAKGGNASQPPSLTCIAMIRDNTTIPTVIVPISPSDLKQFRLIEEAPDMEIDKWSTTDQANCSVAQAYMQKNPLATIQWKCDFFKVQKNLLLAVIDYSDQKKMIHIQLADYSTNDEKCARRLKQLDEAIQGAYEMYTHLSRAVAQYYDTVKDELGELEMQANQYYRIALMETPLDRKQDKAIFQVQTAFEQLQSSLEKSENKVAKYKAEAAKWEAQATAWELDARTAREERAEAIGKLREILKDAEEQEMEEQKTEAIGEEISAKEKELQAKCERLEVELRANSARLAEALRDINKFRAKQLEDITKQEEKYLKLMAKNEQKKLSLQVAMNATEAQLSGSGAPTAAAPQAFPSISGLDPLENICYDLAIQNSLNMRGEIEEQAGVDIVDPD